MISQPAIDSLAAKSQTSPVNIAREYCQHLLLQAIYKQKGASGLYFKGGTALRLLYQRRCDFYTKARGFLKIWILKEKYRLAG